ASVGRVFLAVFFMAVSPVLSPENPLGVGLTATSNFNRDRDYAAKITFVANGADVAKLQGELRMDAQHFSAGTCEMSKSS
nr:hypothetical protein [Myxococcota bacterium]